MLSVPPESQNEVVRKIKALSDVYTDIPTFAESGYPGFSAVSGFGPSAPAKTSMAIIDKRSRRR